jgi:hypothetical protein
MSSKTNHLERRADQVEEELSFVVLFRTKSSQNKFPELESVLAVEPPAFEKSPFEVEYRHTLLCLFSNFDCFLEKRLLFWTICSIKTVFKCLTVFFLSLFPFEGFELRCPIIGTLHSLRATEAHIVYR